MVGWWRSADLLESDTGRAIATLFVCGDRLDILVNSEK